MSAIFIKILKADAVNSSTAETIAILNKKVVGKRKENSKKDFYKTEVCTVLCYVSLSCVFFIFHWR